MNEGYFGARSEKKEIPLGSPTPMNPHMGPPETTMKPIQDMWLRDVAAEGSRTSVDVVVQGTPISKQDWFRCHK